MKQKLITNLRYSGALGIWLCINSPELLCVY